MTSFQWLVLVLLLGIQADVAPLQHDSAHVHTFYTVLSVYCAIRAVFARD